MATLPQVPLIPRVKSQEDYDRAIRTILQYLIQLKNAIEPLLP